MLIVVVIYRCLISAARVVRLSEPNGRTAHADWAFAEMMPGRSGSAAGLKERSRCLMERRLEKYAAIFLAKRTANRCKLSCHDFRRGVKKSATGSMIDVEN
jgi:hypothetical protein